jgi:hypothetical protein
MLATMKAFEQGMERLALSAIAAGDALIAFGAQWRKARRANIKRHLAHSATHISPHSHSR